MRKSFQKEGDSITERQKRFCEEYLIDLNAKQAAIRAGYSKKTAKQIGQRLLTNVDLNSYIQEHLAAIRSEKTASAEEVMEHLTAVLRGESRSQVVVVEGVGDGCSEARCIEKAPDERERLKAAELLGKRYGLFTDKVNMNVTSPIVISGSDDLED